MRIFTLTLALLFVYQLIIWTGLVPAGIDRDSYEHRMITCEHWRYRRQIPQVVIIGSSKTNFLNYDVLGKDVAHLGFGTQGSLTGLAILAASKDVPSLVLVETGETLEWPADANLVDEATAKFQLSDVFSALRHQYQPSAVLLSIFLGLFPPEPPEPVCREQLIRLRTADLSVPFRDDKRAVFVENSKRAQQLIANLQIKGCRVVLFDPPQEEAVAQAQYERETKVFAHSFFDSHHYQWLLNPPGLWHTRDGVHLAKDSSNSYSLWLRKKFDELLLEPKVIQP